MSSSTPARRALATAGCIMMVTAALSAAPVNASTVAPPARTPTFVLPDLTDAGGPSPLSRAGVSAVTADFDDDGNVDALIPNLNRAGVVVLLGDGAGGFHDPTTTTLPDGGSVVAAAAGDVDGDRWLDVVAATFDDEGGAITVLLGQGDGTFDRAQRVDYSTASAVLNVAVADLDDDGDLDLAASVDRNSGDTVEVALGDGDGTFEDPTVYEPPFQLSVEDLDLADVNDDGAPDLVYLEGCPVVRLNNGDGSFGEEICSTDPEARISGVAFALGDFDGDGVLDLAIGGASAEHVSIALGNGAGRFVFEVMYDDVGGQVSSIASGDFTGDGKLDLVASADAEFAAPTRVSTLLRGRGNGTFVRGASYATGGDGLAGADLDGDGDLDLVSAGYGAGSVSATRNLGKGRFRAPRAYTAPDEGSVGTFVRTGDVNGDRRTDVIAATGDGLVNVFRQKRNGELGAATSTAGSGGILSLAAGDLNGDGRTDVVAGSQPSNNLFVMLGQASGRLGAPRAYNNGSSAAVLGVALGDVDGDGDLDIVSNTFSQLSVRPGQGNGTFGAAVLSGAGGGFQVATVLGDLNRDRDLDAVSLIRTGTGDNASTSVIVNLGNGDRTFAVGDQVTLDTNASSAVGFQLSDDRPGIAVVGTRGSHSGRTGLYVLPSTAAGGLGSDYLGGPAGDVTAADLNGDRKADLATIGDSTIAFFTGAGGTVERTWDMPAGRSGFGIAAGNLIGSKRIDLVEVDSTNPQQVVVYENSTRR